MSLKARANVPYEGLTTKEKLDRLEFLIERFAETLTTAPPFRNKKATGRLRGKVEYKEDPEWIQEFEKVLECAPPNLYESKSDLYRCMNRAGLYIVSMLFKAIAEDKNMLDNVKALNDTIRMQVMMQLVVRDSMARDISEQYEKIRKSWMEKGIDDLPKKLHDIEIKEAQHIEVVKPKPEKDDIAINESFFSQSVIKIGDKIYG